MRLADFVAGIARRLAVDELKGRADSEITTLLAPLIDHESVWAEPSSLVPGNASR